jgi:hypothetical protein
MQTMDRIFLAVLVGILGFWLVMWFWLTVIEGLAPYGIGFGD